MAAARIFIGSSSEARTLARVIGDEIDRHEGMQTILWDSQFPAGVILLERIERLPDGIAGAVLLMTPDI
jgi:predicted nucleotide-binding protein